MNACFNFLMAAGRAHCTINACAVACPFVLYHSSYLILASSSVIFYMWLLFRGVQLSHVHAAMILSLEDNSALDLTSRVPTNS